MEAENPIRGVKAVRGEGDGVVGCTFILGDSTIWYMVWYSMVG